MWVVVKGVIGSGPVCGDAIGGREGWGRGRRGSGGVGGGVLSK